MVEYTNALYHTKDTYYELMFVKIQGERRDYGWYLQKSPQKMKKSTPF